MSSADAEFSYFVMLEEMGLSDMAVAHPTAPNAVPDFSDHPSADADASDLFPDAAPSADADADAVPDAVPNREADTFSDAEIVRVRSCDSEAETVRAAATDDDGISDAETPRDRSRSAESGVNDLVQPHQTEARSPSPDSVGDWWNGAFRGSASSSAGAVAASGPLSERADPTLDQPLQSVSAADADADAADDSDADPPMSDAASGADGRAARGGVTVGVTSRAVDADGRAARGGVAVGVNSTAAPDSTFAPIPYMRALDEVRGNPTFILKYLLPFRTPYDDAFQNARGAIEEMLSTYRLPIYKIGTASNPLYRFCNNTYGYHLERYTSMAVLVQSMPRDCGAMETRLIEHFQGKTGNQNILLRANIPKECPCFVYCVMVEYDDFVPKGGRETTPRPR